MDWEEPSRQSINVGEVLTMYRSLSNDCEC